MATIEEQVKSLQAQKDANSAAWHTAATQEEKNKLHAENVKLSGQIDAISGSTSTFDAGTGKWTRTEAPATTVPQESYDLSEQIRKQKAAETEAALAGLKGAYTKGMAAYDAQEDKLPERYRAARNDAAAQSAVAKKNFGEQAAASGLNSGASGQAALDASSAYRGAIAGLNQSQASDLAEIDRAKAALTAEYETAVAQAKASGDASLANALYQELVRVQGLEREDEQTAYSREQDALAKEWQEKVYADQQAAAKYEQDLQKAAAMAQYGFFDGYAELWGLPAETVEAMVKDYATQKQTSEAQAARELADWYAQYGDLSQLKALGVNTSVLETQQALTLAGTGKTTGGSKTGDTTKTVTDLYQSMYDAGVRGEDDAYYYLTMAGYNTTQAKQFTEYFVDWAKKQTSPGQQAGTGATTNSPSGGTMPKQLQDWMKGQVAAESVSGEGLSRENFSSLRQSIARCLSEGNEAGAKRLVEQNANMMSESQAETLYAILSGGAG